MTVISEKDFVITGFSVEFDVEFAAEGNSGAHIHAWFQNAVRAEDLIGRDTGGIESEKRIEGRNPNSGRSRKFLCPMVDSSAADEVSVERLVRENVNHRVKRYVPDAHRSAGKTDVIQSAGVDAEVGVVELHKGAHRGSEPVPGAEIDVPSGVKAACRIAYRLSESDTCIKGKMAVFLSKGNRTAGENGNGCFEEIS